MGWTRLVYHAICLFTPPAIAKYSFQPATEGELRLSRPGCLDLRRGGLTVTHIDTNRSNYIDRVTTRLNWQPNWRVASMQV